MRKLAFITILLLSATAWAESVPPSLRVMVSLPPQAFLVRELAGDAVTVSVLVPQDKNHEVYEPTIEQLRELARADLYLEIGHPHLVFESRWVERLAKDNAKLRLRVVTKNIAMDPADPHLWLAPNLVKVMAENTALALIEIMPEKRSQIEGNLKFLDEKLDNLNGDLAKKFANVKRKTFLVFHPAWGYFAKSYGLHQEAIEQEGRQATAATLAIIIGKAKEEGIKTIFVQPQFARESAEVIAREINAKLVVIDPVGEDLIANIKGTGELIYASLVE